MTTYEPPRIIATLIACRCGGWMRYIGYSRISGDLWQCERCQRVGRA